MFGCGSGTMGAISGGFSLWMLVPMIFRFLLLGAVIYFIVKIFKGNGTNSRSAMRILDEKYANGDITFEEYEIRKGNLNNQNR